VYLLVPLWHPYLLAVGAYLLADPHLTGFSWPECLPSSTPFTLMTNAYCTALAQGVVCRIRQPVTHAGEYVAVGV
jgi:hypothetical protein